MIVNTYAGGVITLDDLNEYQPIWRQAATSSLWGRPVTMVSSPPPFGGDTLQFILQLMSRECHIIDSEQRFAQGKGKCTLKFEFFQINFGKA